MKHETKAAAAAFFLAGILLGDPATRAASSVPAEPTWQKIYVNGREVSMTAYNIGGQNYVKLREIGQKVGFNVYWQDGVRIDTTEAYTGEAPAEPDTELESIRQEMIRRINQIRRENGVAELTVNDSLMDAAQELADHHLRNHDISLECNTVLEKGYPHGFLTNLTVFSPMSKDYIAERAVRNWMYSPGHFQTMIDPGGDSLGVGISFLDGYCYCNMIVGNPDTINPYA